MRCAWSLAVEEEARNVAPVDWLYGHLARPEPGGGALQIGDIDRLGFRFRRRARNAGQDMQARTVEHAGPGRRHFQRVGKVRLPPRHGRQPALAGLPVAGRHVEQHDLDAGIRLRPCHLLRREVVGKQELDRLEARPGGGVEAVQKPVFGEHHREIRCKTRHGQRPFLRLRNAVGLP